LNDDPQAAILDTGNKLAFLMRVAISSSVFKILREHKSVDQVQLIPPKHTKEENHNKNTDKSVMTHESVVLSYLFNIHGKMNSQLQISFYVEVGTLC
jgi:hypothetical protein